MSRKRKIQKRKLAVNSVKSNRIYRRGASGWDDAGKLSVKTGILRTGELLAGEIVSDGKFRDTVQVFALQFPDSRFHRRTIARIMFSFIAKYPQHRNCCRQFRDGKWVERIPPAHCAGELAISICGNAQRDFLRFWNVNPFVPEGCEFHFSVRGVQSNGSHLIPPKEREKVKDCSDFGKGADLEKHWRKEHCTLPKGYYGE